MAGPSREGAIVFDDGFSLESSSLSGDYQKEFEDSAAAELAAVLRFVEDAFYDLPLSSPPPAGTVCPPSELAEYTEEWSGAFQPRLLLQGASLGLEVSCAEQVLAGVEGGGEGQSVAARRPPPPSAVAVVPLLVQGKGARVEALREPPEEVFAEDCGMEEVLAMDGQADDEALHPQSDAWVGAGSDACSYHDRYGVLSLHAYHAAGGQQAVPCGGGRGRRRGASAPTVPPPASRWEAEEEKKRQRHRRRMGMPPVSPAACVQEEIVSQLMSCVWEDMCVKLLPLLEPSSASGGDAGGGQEERGGAGSRRRLEEHHRHQQQQQYEQQYLQQHRQHYGPWLPPQGQGEGDMMMLGHGLPYLSGYAMGAPREEGEEESLMYLGGSYHQPLYRHHSQDLLPKDERIHSHHQQQQQHHQQQQQQARARAAPTGPARGVRGLPWRYHQQQQQQHHQHQQQASREEGLSEAGVSEHALGLVGTRLEVKGSSPGTAEHHGNGQSSQQHQQDHRRDFEQEQRWLLEQQQRGGEGDGEEAEGEDRGTEVVDLSPVPNARALLDERMVVGGRDEEQLSLMERNLNHFLHRHVQAHQQLAASHHQQQQQQQQQQMFQTSSAKRPLRLPFLVQPDGRLQDPWSGKPRAGSPVGQLPAITRMPVMGPGHRAPQSLVSARARAHQQAQRRAQLQEKQQHEGRPPPGGQVPRGRQAGRAPRALGFKEFLLDELEELSPFPSGGAIPSSLMEEESSSNQGTESPPHWQQQQQQQTYADVVKHSNASDNNVPAPPSSFMRVRGFPAHPGRRKRLAQQQQQQQQHQSSRSAAAAAGTSWESRGGVQSYQHMRMMAQAGSSDGSPVPPAAPAAAIQQQQSGRRATALAATRAQPLFLSSRARPGDAGGGDSQVECTLSGREIPQLGSTGAALASDAEQHSPLAQQHYPLALRRLQEQQRASTADATLTPSHRARGTRRLFVPQGKEKDRDKEASSTVSFVPTAATNRSGAGGGGGGGGGGGRATGSGGARRRADEERASRRTGGAGHTRRQASMPPGRVAAAAAAAVSGGGAGEEGGHSPPHHHHQQQQLPDADPSSADIRRSLALGVGGSVAENPQGTPPFLSFASQPLLRDKGGARGFSQQQQQQQQGSIGGSSSARSWSQQQQQQQQQQHRGGGRYVGLGYGVGSGDVQPGSPRDVSSRRPLEHLFALGKGFQ